MQIILKQSTATQQVMVGPFIDDTDFKTAETALTIANTDIKLCKNGAASVNKNSGGATHRVNGMYAITLDATDSNTVGELLISIAVAGAMIVIAKAVVLEEAVYDAMYASGAAGPNTVTPNTTTPPTAAAIRAEIDASSTQLAAIVADTNELQSDDVPTLIAALNNISSATVRAQVDAALVAIHLDHLLAANYDPASKPGVATALLNELVENDGGVSRFTVNALEQGPSGSGASAASIADAVWDEAQSGHVAAGSFGSLLDAKVSEAGGGSAPTAADIRAEIDANSTQLTSIKGDTAQLMADDIPAAIVALDAVVDRVEVDTQNIQSRLPDALVAGNLKADVKAIDASTEAAQDLSASAKTIVRGSAATGTLSTTEMTTDLTEATNDHYNGRIIIWTSGVLKDQATNITDYDGASKKLTFTAVTEAPSNSDTFVIV